MGPSDLLMWLQAQIFSNGVTFSALCGSRTTFVFTDIVSNTYLKNRNLFLIYVSKYFKDQTVTKKNLPFQRAQRLEKNAGYMGIVKPIFPTPN